MRPTTPYHLVTMSPWPICSSMIAGFMTMGLAGWFHNVTNSLSFIFFSLALLAIVLMKWWNDIIREATMQDIHSTFVQKGLRYGMMLFILSEAMFFVSFFWAFFHSSLASTPQIGCVWPPTGITPLNPMALPLLNTALLLSSGVTITWAHKELFNNNSSMIKLALALTLLYGGIFTLIQLMEYNQTSFTIADGIFGSTFFVATGFHGLHVIIGSTFIATCLWRATKLHFLPSHHVGFEMAAWYWHFVDVVWICLYLAIYWWGSL